MATSSYWDTKLAALCIRSVVSLASRRELHIFARRAQVYPSSHNHHPIYRPTTITTTTTSRIEAIVAEMDSSRTGRRGRGRPPTYVWKEDEELSESMEKLKLSIERRRQRQKENYHRKKNMVKQGRHAKNTTPRQETRRAPTVKDGGLILDIALSGNSSSHSHNGSGSGSSSRR